LSAFSGLNYIDAALVEADKINFIYKKSQYLDKAQIAHADDYLQISALLNTGVKRLSVAENFVDVMMAHPTFEKTISGYKHDLTGTYFAAGQLTPDANKSLYSPQYCLTIKPDKYTVVIYDRNTFYIKIFNLAHFDKSRYRTLLQTLVDCDVFIHKSRVINPTPKHKRESMRLILKRDFGLHEYEWGLTFNSEISNILLPVIQREAIVNIDDCYYLNKGKRIQCKIKVYNVSALSEDRRGKPYQYIVGDLMKFEATFQPEFFIHHGYATIASFTSQLAIFSLLLTDILKQFNQHLFNKLTKFEKNKLYLATGTTKGNFMDKLTNPDSLQTMLDGDVLMLKKQVNALFSLIEANTIATKANTLAVNANTVANEANTLAVLANTAALLTAANNANFFSESNAFFKEVDAKTDKRKVRELRLVK
jgi:hypothetical protein